MASRKGGVWRWVPIFLAGTGVILADVVHPGTPGSDTPSTWGDGGDMRDVFVGGGGADEGHGGDENDFMDGGTADDEMFGDDDDDDFSALPGDADAGNGKYDVMNGGNGTDTVYFLVKPNHFCRFNGNIYAADSENEGAWYELVSIERIQFPVTGEEGFPEIKTLEGDDLEAIPTCQTPCGCGPECGCD